MRFSKLWRTLPFLCLAGCRGADTAAKGSEPKDTAFVKVVQYIPDIQVDLHYATAHNFTRRRIYDFSDAWLRYGTVKKLIPVQQALKEKGLYLKIWDAFRPVCAQFKLWEVYPDPVYVADPITGFSSHSRGNTLDITLVHADGSEVVMPTVFDDFSLLADRDYSDCSQEAAANALYLEQLMLQNGFQPYAGEWWHFSDRQEYDVEQCFTPVENVLNRATDGKALALLTEADDSSETAATIRAGECFCVCAKVGSFALTQYREHWGFVPMDRIRKLP